MSSASKSLQEDREMAYRYLLAVWAHEQAGEGLRFSQWPFLAPWRTCPCARVCASQRACMLVSGRGRTYERARRVVRAMRAPASRPRA